MDPENQKWIVLLAQANSQPSTMPDFAVVSNVTNILMLATVSLFAISAFADIYKREKAI